MILLSVIFNFSSLQIADAITSENWFQPDNPRIFQLLATLYDCSKQYNVRQFGWTRVQKCTQAASENEYTRTFASVFARAKAKRIEASRCSATVQKNRILCVEGPHHNWYTHVHMTVFFGILTQRHYQKNWTTRNVKTIFEGLVARIVLNWINIFTRILSLNLIDWVSEFKMKRNKRHSS